MTFKEGQIVAIVRSADGKVLATAKVDKVTEREVRTETPYEQREGWRFLRRYWRATEPHTEMRVPREDKAKREPCRIRPASEADRAAAQRRVDIRRAEERMPTNLNRRAQYEQQIALLEEQLTRWRKGYDHVTTQIAEDEALLASEDAG